MTKDEIVKKRLDLNAKEIQNLYSGLIKLRPNITWRQALPVISLALLGIGFGAIYWPLGCIVIGAMIWWDLSRG